MTRFVVDPVTRVLGALSVHTLLDLNERRVVEARVAATQYRGFERILTGRDPRDAVFISSRACGMCGGAHAVCAARALEMATGCAPPLLGVLVRNIALALECLQDHPFHLYVLAGPDYSSALVEPTTPDVFARATRTGTRFDAVHGYTSMADLMRDLNPQTGRLYVDALRAVRAAREAYVLIAGKYPHPQTIVPGGIGASITQTVMHDVLVRVSRFFDYAKRTAAIWDDLVAFFYDADTRYRNVGRRRANLIDSGAFDHPDAAGRPWATPGAIVDGRLVAADLTAIDERVEEFVDHAFYDASADDGRWNTVTRPRPEARNWHGRYTWATAPRWGRTAMEAGCYARLWSTALAKTLPSNAFIEATGHSLKMRVPADALPEADLEWHVPPAWNAFERNRARAYSVAFSVMVAFDNCRAALERMRSGDTRTSTPIDMLARGERRGLGSWGGGRGYLTHHLVIDRGAIANYRILTGSTWNLSPTDRWGQPGPCEEAVLNTPLLEQTDDPAEFRGIDILRAIRSFDPCLPCATH